MIARTKSMFGLVPIVPWHWGKTLLSAHCPMTLALRIRPYSGPRCVADTHSYTSFTSLVLFLASGSFTSCMSDWLVWVCCWVTIGSTLKSLESSLCVVFTLCLSICPSDSHCLDFELSALSPQLREIQWALRHHFLSYRLESLSWH